MRAATILGPLALTLALGACVQSSPMMEQSSRVLAKRVVNEAVARRFPGVNVEPYSDCIIDNASIGEITQLAGNAVTGLNDQTFALVVEIASRPATTSCIAQATLTNAMPRA